MVNRITDRNQEVIHTGTSQESRELLAMHPTYFKIHEQSLQDFARFLSTFAQLVTYYDHHNLPQGSWADFFENDLTLQLIQLQAFDPDKIAADFGNLLEAGKRLARGASNDQLVESGIRIIFGLLHKVEKLRWVSHEVPELKQEILTLIEDKFAPIRARCLAYLRGGVEEKIAKEPLFRNFGSAWKVPDEETARFVFALDPDLSELNRMFSQLVNFIRLLQDRGAQYLKEMLDSGNVQPHIGMLFALHQMMATAGKDLNEFNARHLDYYYRTVLKLREKAGSPDQVHVVFSLAQNTSRLQLPAGTRLDAGVDVSGKNRVYALDRNIVLNKTIIRAIKGIVHDEIPPDYRILSNLEAEVESYFVNSRILEKESNLVGGMQTFFPGLAIAAPILHLDPANSLIKIQFYFENDSFLGFRDMIFEEAWKVYGVPGPERSNAYRILKVNQLIKDLFVVTYSGEGGEWVEVNQENAAFKLLSTGERLVFNLLELEILLSPADPPIMPCESDEFPHAKKSGIPIFKCSLNPSKIYLYFTLVELVLETINIEVKVIDLRSLILQNDYGPLDLNVPFEPFGPLPKIGSSFYLGHPRIFNHHLSEIKINLEWFEVPIENQGFPEYYQDYGGVESNEDFQIGVSILDQKQWKPRSGRQRVSLFETLESQAREGERRNLRVSKVTLIKDLDMSLLKMRPGPSVGSLVMYNHETLSGFLRLELTSPGMAFGHKLYPEIVGKASMEAILKKRFVPPPNPPFVPTAKSVSLDFSASTSIHFHKQVQGEDQWIYHLHPLGVDFLNDEFGKVPKRFLAHYERGAHLFVGLDQYEVGREISLLFEINESGALDYEEPLHVEWACLKDNQWIPLLPEEILYDTTDGMLRNGLLVLVLKEVPELTSGIMPHGHLWLRCFSKTGNLFLRNVLNVHCQAASATFVDQGNSPDHYKTGLPPQSITDLLPGNVKVETVRQPYPSFGGRAAEEGSSFFTRISERLRHKGRIVSAWDCEALVLSEFPQIQKVICLSHLNPEYQLSPGELMVIVIPKVTAREREELRVPRVSPAVLMEITRFLKRLSSPFVKINVRNAALEYVRVNMGVKFQKGYTDITYYKNKLNKEVYQFLMPWLFQEGAEVRPGQSIYAANIIRFLDSREYIDYVANFSLFHFVNGKLIPPQKTGTSKQVASPSTPGAVLLSMPQHHIDLINESGAPLEGIGLFATGVDLTIPGEPDHQENGIEMQAISKDFSIPDNKQAQVENISIKLRWR